MPVDRSLLPPLPGKPDWYIEDAPRAIDAQLRGALDWPELRAPAPAPVAQAEPALLPNPSPLAAPIFPTVTPRAEHGGRGLKRVLAGRFKH